MDAYGYCERTTGGFWAEPVNAVTNVAFLLAALWAARDLRRADTGRTTIDLAGLVVVLTAIGVGSFLFHTFSEPWAAAADTVPIAVFILGYVVVFARRFGGLPWSRAWLAAPAYLLSALVVVYDVSLIDIPVPGPYLAALLGLASLSAWSTTRRDPALRGPRRTLVAATLLFALSLALRQLDRPVCAEWPLGTHFAWHLCNAAVLYLLLRAAIHRMANGDSRENAS